VRRKLTPEEAEELARRRREALVEANPNLANPYLASNEGMTLEEAEELARRRRKELGIKLDGLAEM